MLFVCRRCCYFCFYLLLCFFYLVAWFITIGLNTFRYCCYCNCSSSSYFCRCYDFHNCYKPTLTIAIACNDLPQNVEKLYLFLVASLYVAYICFYCNIFFCLLLLLSFFIWSFVGLFILLVFLHFFIILLLLALLSQIPHITNIHIPLLYPKENKNPTLTHTIYKFIGTF